MFLGEYFHTIDDKGRLTIPSKFRGELSAGLVVTKGMDRCLVIYTLDAWGRLKERIANLPVTDRTARDLRRLVFASASDTAPDGQGRINIPQPLRDFAGLDGQIIVAGCDSYIELWAPDAWAEVQSRVEEDDSSAERWAALGI
jgi:MraZ protein